MTHTVSVAKQFSQFPAGRYNEDGPYPGQKFRERFLVPALQNHPHVTVLLDGTMGYGSSFLEEVFGGLVREHGFRAVDLRNRLTIVSKIDPSLEREAWLYIDEAVVAALGR